MSNPLDLNNLPEDFSRDHDKQPLDLSSALVAAAAGRYKKKKNGAKDGSRKQVYKCRFCSLTFLKSQSLGGHMNRHRQEKEKETLNRARQLVFGKDNFYQLGNQPMVHGGYEHQASGYNMGSPSSYLTSLFSGGSTIALPPAPPHPHLPSLGIPYSSGQDYVMGHVYSGNPQFIHMINRIATSPLPNDPNNDYTCIRAPVEQAFTVSGESGGGGGSRHANVTD